ncbi:MAG TPA: hypothetical protein VFF15_03675 [Flavobacteriaceae bacterium]|nr:hypothetical protein [Flavobacteriaceae bacterium]
MKKTTNNHSLLPKLYCSIFGHNFEISKKVTRHVKEYTCTNCKKELTTNGNGYLTELTPTYKEINSVLERIYTNRMMRLKERRMYAEPTYKVTA